MGLNSILEKLIGFIKHSAFVKSFQVDKRKFLVAVLFDVVYFGILFFGFVLLYTLIKGNIPTLLQSYALSQKVEGMEYNALMSEFNPIMHAMYAVIAYFVIFTIGFLVINSFFKTFILSRLLKKKYSFRLFWKGIVVSLIIYATIAILFVLVVIPLLSYNEPFIMTAMLTVVVFFSVMLMNLLKISLVAKEKIFAAIAVTHAIIWLRFYLFIVPVLIMSGFFGLLLSFSKYLIKMPFGLGFALSFVLIVAFITWGKNYFYAVAQKIKPIAKDLNTI